jgi:hypothetical protein
MHEATPRGSLLVNGRPVTSKQLASLVGAGQKEVEGYLAELEDAGVYSKEDNGIIYSRRIRRDDEKLERDKANGKGGGNPTLKPNANRGVNPPLKAQKPEARSQKPEENLPAQQTLAARAGPENPDEPKPIDQAELDRVEAACRTALGELAPADLVCGPIALVCRQFSLSSVVLALQSEARRPRRKPIRTWALWADIVAETLKQKPFEKSQDPLPATEPRVDFGGGFSAPHSTIRIMISRGKWPVDWGPKPGEAGCRVPPELLAEISGEVAA